MPHDNAHRIRRGPRGHLRQRAAQDRLLRKALAAGGGAGSLYIPTAVESSRRQYRWSERLHLLSI